MTALIVAAVLLVQAPAPQTPAVMGVISGTVLAADSGEAIAGVQVVARSLVPSPQGALALPVSVTTDNQGRFEFASLNPGEYIVIVDGTATQRYATQAYGAREPGLQNTGTATHVSVDAAGQTTHDIVVKLVRGGTISGRILGLRGEPFVDAEVRVYRSSFDALGNKRWNISDPMPTIVNDRGEYRMFGVEPGLVYLSAGPQLELVVLTPGGEASRYAESTFYPDAADFSTASPIQIKPGAELSNMDIQLLPRQPVFKVRGRLLDSTTGQAPPASNVQFSLIPRDHELGTLRGYQPQFGADGAFELNDIVEGEYWLAVQIRAPMLRPEPGQQRVVPPALIAVQRIEVRGADVAGLTLTFAPPVQVGGRVNIENATAATLAGSPPIRILLDVVRNGAFPMNMAYAARTGEVGPDGAFVIADVQPGEYRVKLSGLPEDTYAREARLGTVDALTEPVAIGAALVDRLEVSLVRGGGRVEGQLLNAQRLPVASAQVVLIPDRLPGRTDLYKTATSDAMGRFGFRGIMPGDYKVFAWEFLENFRYFDRDFVARFEDRGESVRVEDGASKSVTVRQIPTR